MTEREEYSEKRKGLIGTIVFHSVLLILLFVLGFFTPLPLPGEEGILVNFGDSPNGLGKQEPSPVRKRQETPPPRREEQKTTSQPVKQTPAPQVSKPEPQPAKEVAMTQDYEETVTIDAAEEKKHEKDRKRKLELDKKKKQEQEALKHNQEQEAEQKRLAEIKRKKQEEIDRKAREEAERKAREEAERKAREEAERKRKEEEQRKIAEINSRTQGAFSNSGSGGEGSGQGKSQGVTFPGGNQGVSSGDPNAGKYGTGGSGSGNQGTGSGVSYDLGGRSAVTLPKPKYPGNDAGIVVVKVTVNKYGKVTAAEPGARGTTIANKAFWDEAKEAALKAKFNIDEKAPAFQQGTISYRFVLD